MSYPHLGSRGLAQASHLRAAPLPSSTPPKPQQGSCMGVRPRVGQLQPAPPVENYSHSAGSSDWDERFHVSSPPDKQAMSTRGGRRKLPSSVSSIYRAPVPSAPPSHPHRLTSRMPPPPSSANGLPTAVNASAASRLSRSAPDPNPRGLSARLLQGTSSSRQRTRPQPPPRSPTLQPLHSHHSNSSSSSSLSSPSSASPPVGGSSSLRNPLRDLNFSPRLTSSGIRTPTQRSPTLAPLPPPPDVRRSTSSSPRRQPHHNGHNGQQQLESLRPKHRCGQKGGSSRKWQEMPTPQHTSNREDRENDPPCADKGRGVVGVKPTPGPGLGQGLAGLHPLRRAISEGSRLFPGDPLPSLPLLDTRGHSNDTSASSAPSVLSPLLLDLPHEDEDEEEAAEPQKRMHISQNGALAIDRFEIRKTGLLLRSQGEQEDEQAEGEEGTNFQESLAPLAMLGRGSGGVVWQALHVPTLRLVAVKTIAVFEEGRRHQMVRELRALYGNLTPLSPETPAFPGSRGDVGSAQGDACCPQIVSLYDAYVNPAEGNVSIVQEYMDGGSLQDLVECGGCQDEKVLARIAMQVLQGLAFLHERRQIHRDIKPANLLTSHNGTVKISDFGLVRHLETSISQAETFVGTFTYMSPERLCGEEYSYSADIWALGLTVLTLALGRFPYDDTSGYWGLLSALREREPPQPPAHYSEAFRDFTHQCLRKEPSTRPSAKALLQHPFMQTALEGQEGTLGDAWKQGTSSPTDDGEEEMEEEEDEEEGLVECEGARLELEDLLDALQAYYTQNWHTHAATKGRVAFPHFHPRAVRGLARQLGIPFPYVRRRFRRLVCYLMAVLHEADEMTEDEEESPGLALSPSGSHEPLRLSLSDDALDRHGHPEGKLPLSFSDDEEDGCQGRVPLSFSEDDDDDMQQMQVHSPGGKEGGRESGESMAGWRRGLAAEYGGLCVEVGGTREERFESLTPESSNGSLTPEDPAFAKTLRR